MRPTAPLARVAINHFKAGCVALAALFSISCGGGGGPTGPPAVERVSVGLAQSSITVGQTTTASATLYDAGGNVLSGRTISWSSTDPNIASVDGQGLVTAVAPGNATISATSEGKTGAAVVAVAQIPVARISVSLAASTINVSATTQATAVLQDANNNVLTGRTVTWTSGSQSIATVNSSGLVTGVAAGASNITASSEGVSGFAVLTVTPPAVASVTVALTSQTLAPTSKTQAAATPRDAAGNIIFGRSVTWSSDNQSVATVTAAGVVTAVAVGTANIVATIDGVPGSTPLSVAVSAGYGSNLEKIKIVDIGTTFTPTISGPSPSAATFTSRASSIATVNAQGVITGVGPGQVWIAASAPGFAPDSVYVIVPRNSTGPLLRSDVTNYIVHPGATDTVNIILDTRSTPIGGSEFILGYTTSPTILASGDVEPMGSPAPVLSIIQAGVFRASLASSSPLSGQLTVLQLIFTAPVASASDPPLRAGFLTLTLLDIVDPTGADLLPVSTSTRIPIIIQ